MIIYGISLPIPLGWLGGVVGNMGDGCGRPTWDYRRRVRGVDPSSFTTTTPKLGPHTLLHPPLLRLQLLLLLLLLLQLL